MEYENLLGEAEHLGLYVCEKNIKGNIKGLYHGKTVLLNKSIETHTDKYCILAEEIGHFYTSKGNITNQNELSNIKQEKQARRWAYEKLIPLSKILKAHQLNINGKFELIEFFGVTESFLNCAIQYYKDKYGTHTKYDEYIIYFEPLNVVKSE